MIPRFLAVPLVSNVLILPIQTLHHLKCDNTRSASVDHMLCGKYCDPVIHVYTSRLQQCDEGACTQSCIISLYVKLITPLFHVFQITLEKTSQYLQFMKPFQFDNVKNVWL